MKYFRVRGPEGEVFCVGVRELRIALKPYKSPSSMVVTAMRNIDTLQPGQKATYIDGVTVESLHQSTFFMFFRSRAIQERNWFAISDGQ